MNKAVQNLEILLAEAQYRNLQNMFRSPEDFAVSKFFKLLLFIFFSICTCIWRDPENIVFMYNETHIVKTIHHIPYFN